MSTKPTASDLADRLNRRLLAAGQLQTQAARSMALDAGALGIMAVDFAAATIFGAGGAFDLWILALLLLGLSLALAVWTLRLPAAELIGHSLTDAPQAPEHKDEHYPEDSLLNDLARDIETNEYALARKDRLFDGALSLLVFAIIVALAGKLL